MDLWIRSQDKETLLKTENVSIDNENWVLGNLISDDNKCICDYWRLGHYATKERALEVLDEIQNILKPIIHYEPITRERIDYTKPYVQTEQIGSKSMIQELSTYVYEMPKE